jgi:hypothetical protein
MAHGVRAKQYWCLPKSVSSFLPIQARNAHWNSHQSVSTFKRGDVTMRIKSVLASCVIALVIVALWAPISEAYPTYSQGKVINPAGEEETWGYCKTCHGDFRDPDYVSLSDGQPWAEVYTEVEETEPVLELGLHDIHRHIMVDKIGRSRCSVCHKESGAPDRFYPTRLSWSGGGEGLDPIGCVGCHGRAEDDEAQGSPLSGGYAAGLRQHHTGAGVKACMTCHADANPANYIPVGENVLPPYYFQPDEVFPNKPTDPCNPHGEEDYAGGREGLDNDGDGLYDKRDPDCRPIGPGNNNGRR